MSGETPRINPHRVVLELEQTQKDLRELETKVSDLANSLSALAARMEKWEEEEAQRYDR